MNPQVRATGPNCPNRQSGRGGSPTGAAPSKARLCVYSHLTTVYKQAAKRHRPLDPYGCWRRVHKARNYLVSETVLQGRLLAVGSKAFLFAVRFGREGQLPFSRKLYNQSVKVVRGLGHDI